MMMVIIDGEVGVRAISGAISEAHQMSYPILNQKSESCPYCLHESGGCVGEQVQGLGVLGQTERRGSQRRLEGRRRPGTSTGKGG